MLTSPRLLRLAAAALLLLAAAPRAARCQVLEIRLGDLAAGGDGTGTADPQYVGIHPDTGQLETFHINAPITIGDGVALQEVDDAVSTFIDSVFIVSQPGMQVVTEGVIFDFPAQDLLAPPQTWDHILKDRIGGEDYPVIVGGKTFEHGLGIHAAAGITFDLDALRAVHGAEAVGEVSAFAGMGDSPACLATPGWVACYMVLSDGAEILGSASHRTQRGGKWLRLSIPPEARFLTLAAGAGNGQFFCNSGVFAGAAVTPIAPVTFERDLPEGFAAGDSIEVSIQVEVNKPPVNAVEVRERVPFSWVASEPSPPGAIEVDARGRQTVVWNLQGGVTSRTLTYRLLVPTPYADVAFLGSTARADGKEVPIFGDTEVTGGTPANVTGALAVTLKLPAANCAGAALGEGAQARDYLADGDLLTESTVVPVAGESVAPDFSGASPSPGPGAPDGLTWRGVSGPGWFDLDGCDDCMSYVAFYAVNPTAASLRVRIGSASDDGEQILVDGAERWNHSIARPAGGPDIQDHSPPFDLAPGKHLVLQKVFEGCGGFNSAIRFEDEDGNPLVLLKYTTDPAADEPDPGDPAYGGARAYVLRDIPESLDVGEEGWITLKLRPKEPTVGATVEETVPPGFIIREATDGGVQERDTIRWTLPGPLADRDLRYRVAAGEGAADGVFRGTAVLGGRTAEILGDRVFERGVTDAAGFIKHWLVLGPLDTQGLWSGDPNDPPFDLDAPAAAPEAGDLRLDYLSDGTLTEKTIRPFDGMRVAPAFRGDGVTGSRAVAFEALARECAPEVPTWERFVSRTGTFNHNEYFGADVNSHVTYAACFVKHGAGPDVVLEGVKLAFDSDDACIVYLNGREVAAFEPPPCAAAGCGRGLGPEGTVADVAGVSLLPGENPLLVRVHDGAGGSGFRLRFQDDQGRPLLPPAISVSLFPRNAPPPVYVRRVLSADSYRLPETPSVGLQVVPSGTHAVTIRELLPAGWSAAEVSDDGVAAPGGIQWTLPAVSETRSLGYKLVPADCPAGGSFCGHGAQGSFYTVDGTASHALLGDRSFRRNARGTDAPGIWDVRDLGTTGGGTQGVALHAFEVLGTGRGVEATRDEFRFVAVPASGDFELSARIDCLQDPGGSGRAGLMVRDTFDTFAANVFFALSSTAPAGGGAGTLRATFRRETSKTRSTSSINIADRNVLTLPVWLKLKREGAKIILERSQDGAAYTEVARRDVGIAATAINFRDDTLIGLAVTGGGGGAALASFREVSEPAFEPVRPEPPLNLTGTLEALEVLRVNLAWTAPAAGPPPTAYVVYRSTAPGGPYAAISEVAAPRTEYTDVGIEVDVRYCYVVRSKRGGLESADSNETCPTKGLPPRFRRGDVNVDGKVDITDPVRLLGFLFLGQPKPECLDAGDTDDSGLADISDAVSSLGFQFLGGAPPAPPGTERCGQDPEPEVPDLGCEVTCG